MTKQSEEQKERLIKLVQAAVEQDKSLRTELAVGDKFRFIRDRLVALLQQVEETLSTADLANQGKTSLLAEDEMLVYIYLFNAQGLAVKTWEKMVTGSVYYEYSVNRPIYIEKNDVEAVIRNKLNKAQHGFITIAIKKDALLAAPAGMENAKDAIGNTVYKVKEGSLHANRMVSFTHQLREYVVNSDGELTLKEE